MKPTPEQVEAAKAYARDEETGEQLELLRELDPADSTTSNAASILLAALEAAEQDGADLLKGLQLMLQTAALHGASSAELSVGWNALNAVHDRKAQP